MFKKTVGAAALIALAACGRADSPRDVRVIATGAGVTLTAPTASPRLDVVAGYLGQSTEGLTARQSLGRDGLVHVQITQDIGGVRVLGAYARAAMLPTGELVHVIDNLAPRGSVPAPSLPAEAALRAALAYHGYVAPATLVVLDVTGNVTTFEQTAELYAGPQVERVAYVDRSGVIAGGFSVQTWSGRKNLLHNTLVDDGGGIVSTELRTAHDAYNVFTEDPLKGAQTVVQGPGSGNAESPAGWLGAGSQLNLNVSGNNVNAYLDADGNNRPDRGGTAVTTGQFLTAVDLGVTPGTTGNREVAIANLFYLNNVVHDVLYRHGFTEAAGNFQVDNFGNGGSAGDPVNAEAQDGSGTDNANFATPNDGQKPRMQMYLWTGAGPTHEVVVGADVYGASGAEFGKALTTSGVSGALALANDGVGTGSDACEPIVGSLSGKLAIVDRGNCAFTVKALNAQNAGATGVIVVNTVPGTFGMGGTDKKVRIQSVMVSDTDGAALKAAAGAAATERKKAQQPLQIDGDLDSDVVFHEFGHGLTWRMIGGMSGPLAGAIGEGASDVVAFSINGDDRIGEYAGSSPVGIRSAPYSGYPRTYGNVTGAEVHDDGEVYAAAMWRLRELFVANGRSIDEYLDLFVDGMNFTPSTPRFEDMRDGMLQADALRGGGSSCLIWSAFAQFGVGVDASGVAGPSSVTVTESFTVPSQCL